MPSSSTSIPFPPPPPLLLLLLLLLLFSFQAYSEDDDVKLSLVTFLKQLTGEETQVHENWRWNPSTDPCTGGWKGVSCNQRATSVRKVVLENLNLRGSIDASSLCKAPRLAVLSLRGNDIQGPLQHEISECTQLTHLFIDGNRLSGELPPSLSGLNNLRRIDISNNNFSGELPDLARVSGLMTFFAQNNRLSGPIPEFNFNNLLQFDVSDNLLTGRIPDGAVKFGLESFSGNPGLCGAPLNSTCTTTSTPPAPSKQEKSSRKVSGEKIAIYMGYVFLAICVVLLLAVLIYKHKWKKESTSTWNNESKKNSVKPIGSSSLSDGGENRSEYSLNSNMDSPMVASALVVLRRPPIADLSFESLLKAPAELLGRGKFGSLYKVLLEDGTTLVVKRVKDWRISGEEFARRMARIDRAKHGNVLPAVAFYCSKQEKLVVYEYQQNGSVFKRLHANHEDHPFDWNNRLNVAASIANGLAFMHQELDDQGLGHGNLKSSNVLLDANMNPRISEYALTPTTATTSHDQNPPNTSRSSFMADVYNFGVMLLELLTGKVVQNNGSELAQWVQSVVREEWTVEVFDRALIEEGAGEGAMVSLLQVALKCMDSSADARPSMGHVAGLIRDIKEEGERSIASEV